MVDFCYTSEKTNLQNFYTAAESFYAEMKLFSIRKIGW